MTNKEARSLNLCEVWAFVLLAACYINISLFLLLKFILFPLQCQIYREEDRQRGRSSLWWFTPQVNSMAGTVLIHSQEPGISSRSPTWVQGPKALTGFPGYKQRARWQVKQLPALQPLSIWDPGDFKVRTLADWPRCLAHINSSLL